MKYYSFSKKEWIEISTMNDVHLKNAFKSRCHQYGVDLSSMNDSTWNQLDELVNNDLVTQSMVRELFKRLITS